MRRGWEIPSGRGIDAGLSLVTGEGDSFQMHTEGLGAASSLLVLSKTHGGRGLGLRACDLISQFWELDLRNVSEI